MFSDTEAKATAGGGGDAEAVVGTEADDPDNAVVGVDKDADTVFLKDVHLAVFQKVAQAPLLFHAERIEAVARAPTPHGERQMHAVGIDILDSLLFATKVGQLVRAEGSGVDFKGGKEAVVDQNKTVAVDGGHVGGREEAGARLRARQGGDDVVDHRSRETVGPQQLEEERALGVELAQVIEFEVVVVEAEGRGGGLPQPLAEFGDGIVVDCLDLTEAFHIGHHGGVDRGIELAQERHQAVAYLVAPVLEAAVGAVLDITDAVLDDIVVDVLPREAEHGADEGHQRALGQRLDTMKAGDAGATEEVEEEGLDGVIAMVGGGYIAEVVLTAEVEEVAVAQPTGGLLNAVVILRGELAGVEVGGVEFHTQLLGKTAHELLVAVAIARAQVEIAMDDGEGDAGSEEEVGHTHGVATTANGQQHLPPAGGEEVLLFDIVLETP